MSLVLYVIYVPEGIDIMGKMWESCGNGGNGSCNGNSNPPAQECVDADNKLVLFVLYVLVEDVMASHQNTGSSRTYYFMQKMFNFEPVGVFEDFTIGLENTGLILKLRDEPIALMDPVEVKIVIASEVEGEPERVITTTGKLIADGYDADYDTIQLSEHLCRYNPRLMLLNGTEDKLVAPEDVNRTFDVVCKNAESFTTRLGPTIYTVGLAVGGELPYSHFDLVFGEDAPNTVFPAILSFLEGTCEGRYQTI